MKLLGDSIAALRGLKSGLVHMTGDKRALTSPCLWLGWQGGAEFGVTLYHVASTLVAMSAGLGLAVQLLVHAVYCHSKQLSRVAKARTHERLCAHCETSQNIWQWDSFSFVCCVCLSVQLDLVATVFAPHSRSCEVFAHGHLPH